MVVGYKNNVSTSHTYGTAILGDCENLNIVKRVNAMITDYVAIVRQKYQKFCLGGGHYFVLKKKMLHQLFMLPDVLQSQNRKI